MEGNREILNDSLAKWIEEDAESRTIFSVLGDEKDGSTTCGLFGREDRVVSSIVNEMLHDTSIARIIQISCKIYNEILEETLTKNNPQTKSNKTRNLS